MNRSYIPWIILAVLLGLFIGYCVWGPTWGVPPNLKSDVLKDTLSIVLTVVSIAVAVVGFFVYRIVSSTLEREREAFEEKTSRRIMIESRKWRARLTLNMGYNLWKIGDLKEAIQWTKEAHGIHARELDEREPENELLLGQIRNNLASYYAQAGEERDLARGYAAYIHGISDKYPAERETWEGTYKEVFDAFPDQ